MFRVFCVFFAKKLVGCCFVESFFGVGPPLVTLVEQRLARRILITFDAVDETCTRSDDVTLDP